jgi:hypothetical protein
VLEGSTLGPLDGGVFRFCDDLESERTMGDDDIPRLANANAGERLGIRDGEVWPRILKDCFIEPSVTGIDTEKAHRLQCFEVQRSSLTLGKGL